MNKYDCTKTLDYVHERGRMCDFYYTTCENCPMDKLNTFDGRCSAVRAITGDHIATVQDWSNEHPERPELTAQQREALQALKTLGFKYIAKDSTGGFYAHQSRPNKGTTLWSNGSNLVNILHMDILSPLCSWSDDEPTSVDDLLTDAEENK